MAKPKADPTPALPTSMPETSAKDVRALMAEIDDLRGKLRIADEKRSEAEQRALATAEAQGMLMQADRPDVLTGKTRKVKKCVGYETVGYKDDGRDIKKPKFKEVEIPLYFYRIDIPPVGGTALRINDVEYYHGTVYTFDEDELRSVKEMVYRLWDHERNIHGSNENAYRKPLERRI